MNHKLQVTIDVNAGTITARQCCSVDIGGHTIRFAEEVDASSVFDALKTLAQQNRKELERKTKDAALEHAAALASINRRGKKQLQVGGEMDAKGEGQ